MKNFKTKKAFITIIAIAMARTFQGCSSGDDEEPLVYPDNVLNAVPDPAFRDYLVLHDANKDGNGVITKEEAQNVTELSFFSKNNTSVGFGGIKSLKGIEYFPNLEYLDCNDNLLDSLDLSRNKKIKEIYCAKNNLKFLKFHPNNVESISCSDNQLKELDVSRCTKLDYLNASNNQLTTINVKNCPELHLFYISYNQLTSLDVRYCRNMTTLLCDHNALTSLDISKNPLNTLECQSNQLTDLDISARKKDLSKVDCSENQIVALDASYSKDLHIIICNPMATFKMLYMPEDYGWPRAIIEIPSQAKIEKLSH